MIRLLAIVSADKDLQKELGLRIRSLVEHSRAEVDCLRYQAFNDNQSCDFFFVEEWESKECLDEHARSAPFADFVDYLKTHGLQVRIHQIEEV